MDNQFCSMSGCVDPVEGMFIPVVDDPGVTPLCAAHSRLVTGLLEELCSDRERERNRRAHRTLAEIYGLPPDRQPGAGSGYGVEAERG